MSIKVSSLWRKVLIKVKVAGVWRTVTGAYTKVGGVWKQTLNMSVVTYPTLTDVLSDVTDWVNDATRGWYKDTYSWNAQSPVNLSTEFLSKIRQISAVFTSYHDTPAGCLGESYIRLSLSNSAVITIGTSDSHSVASSGQMVYRGDAGGTLITTDNQIDVKMTYTLPAGVTIVDMQFASNGYNNGATYYPFTTRGMKDLTLVVEG
ncbi:hypothetical protein D3C85_15480 [compost metagenome]